MVLTLVADCTEKGKWGCKFTLTALGDSGRIQKFSGLQEALGWRNNRLPIPGFVNTTQ